jgi:hypothetical protein
MKSLMIDIHNWIKKVSTKKKELNNYSVCPFARLFYKSPKLKIIKTTSDNIVVPDDFFEIIIFVIVNKITQNQLTLLCNNLNKKYKKLVFLPDHKSRKTFIKNIQTNNGKHNLIMCQPKNKLKEARDILKKTNYYKNWNKKYLKEIMKFGK